MESSEFVDYYEILELSPNADAGAVERVFRYLAQRYHPDDPETGDRDRFDLVLQAHAALKDPAKRAKYDLQYNQKFGGNRHRPLDDGVDLAGVDHDVAVQDKLMSIFYTKRRQNIRDPGVPDFELERLLETDIEHIEFHIWYLKAKGWIERLENGMLAITVEGVDHLNSDSKKRTSKRLITDQSQTG
jgi:curved DNA-binding protein CbpA